MWYRAIPGAARAVNISGDGRVAVVGVSDGTIRWYRMKDGRELAAFYPHSDRKRWVLWTPSGYYDASEGGDALIGWHVNNGRDREASFYPVSRFFERFYRPEVMARAIKGVEVDTAVVALLGEKAAPDIEAAGIKPPPEVAILSPLPGRQFDSEALEVKIVAEDMGGGIDEVLLYQNGKILPRESVAKVKKEGSTQEHLYRVKLIEGANQLKVVALSRDRIESNPMEITVTLRGAEKESDLHLVVVGINRYKNAALNLTYAETDAKGIQGFFQSADVKKLFKNVHVYSLMSEQATGQKIKGLFAEVGRKAQPQDTLLIYLAGHGDTVGEEWYFIPHDVVSPEIEAGSKKRRHLQRRDQRGHQAVQGPEGLRDDRRLQVRQAHPRHAQHRGAQGPRPACPLHGHLHRLRLDGPAVRRRDQGAGPRRFHLHASRGAQGHRGRKEGDGGGAHPLREGEAPGAHGEAPGPGPVPRELGLGHGLPPRAALSVKV